MEPLINDLALILVVAGAMTLLFKKLKQPLVLGYIVAGFLVSPNMPYMSSVTDLENIKLWSDIGVIFLMFALGLEFNIKKLMKMGSKPFIAAGATIASMVILGAMVGAIFGWSRMNCIFLGCMLAMSSTTIIFKAFDDMGLRNERWAGMVLSVLIIEDILAIVMMVVLSTLAVSQHVEGTELVQNIMQLVFFLVLWFLVGIYVIPWMLRKLKSLFNDEILLIVALALCFGMVIIASIVGFSAAFGAFVMGSILAGTLKGEHIAELVAPVKNLFGAIFFVSVGMMVDVALIAQYWLPIVSIILTVILGQMVFGSLSYLLSGQDVKSAVKCGFSMTQIGEFAFILATLGTSLGVTADYLYPIVVAVSVFTTFTTPYMVRLATPCGNSIEKVLPEKLKAAIARYSTEAPATTGDSQIWKPYIGQVLKTVLIWGILSIAVITAMLYYVEPIVYELMGENLGRYVMAAGTLIVAAPFLWGLMLKNQKSEEEMRVWKHSSNSLYRGPVAAIRLMRVLAGALLACQVLTSTLNLGGGFVVLVAVIIVYVIAENNLFSKKNAEMTANFTERFNEKENSGKMRFEGDLVQKSINIMTYEIGYESFAAGQTLRELNLGKQYGVHAVAIIRGEEHINIPSGESMIFPGDKIKVIGSDEELSKFGKAVTSGRNLSGYYHSTEDINLKRVEIAEKSKLAGKSVMESRLREDYRCMLVGIEEDDSENLKVPTPQTIFKSGDVLWVVGEENKIKLLGKA